MITVAVADDHDRMRDVVSALINQVPGYSVVIRATNGFDLLMQLGAIKKLPSIAIVDIEMPVMDGLSVTDFISPRFPEMDIIILSSHLHHTTIGDMIEAGAKGYITKNNLSVSTLGSAFSTIAAGEIFIDPFLKYKRDMQTDRSEKSALENIQLRDITEKEKTFLQLAATSITYEQIAQLMNVAKESVYNYQKSLKEKLGISTRQEFMLYAIRHGIAKIARIR